MITQENIFVSDDDFDLFDAKMQMMLGYPDDSKCVLDNGITVELCEEFVMADVEMLIDNIDLMVTI